MRALAHRPSQSRDQRSLDPKRSLVVLSARRTERHAVPRRHSDPSNDGVTTAGHDFGRIPVHSRSPVSLQAKLTVNTPGDTYEQEADRVSEQVMRTPGSEALGGCACGGSCSSCKGKQPTNMPEGLQTARGPGGARLNAVPGVVHDALRSPGQPLDPAVRSFMES